MSTHGSSSESIFVTGDHLKSPRFAYWHHGLYIGNSLVIHYSGFADEIRAGTVEIACLEEFANGNDIDVVPHFNRSFSRSESIERAYLRLGEDWYNLVLNNCEHFVNWCIEGNHESPQVESVTGAVASVGAMAYLKSNPAVQVALIKKIRQLAAVISHPASDKAARSLVSGALTRPILSAVGHRLGTPTVQSTASSLVAHTMGSRTVSNLMTSTGAGAMHTAGVTGVATTTALTGLVGATTVTTLSTVALPITAAISVGYGIKKIWDWW